MSGRGSQIWTCTDHLHGGRYSQPQQHVRITYRYGLTLLAETVEDVERSLRIIDKVMTKWELKLYWGSEKRSCM